MQRKRKGLANLVEAAHIVLVRHGESTWNREGRMQGQYAGISPPRLTELGKRQAELVGAHLATRFSKTVRAVYTSDLLRAKETADIIGAALQFGSPISLVAGWRERSLGCLEGLTVREIERCPASRAILQGLATQQGGEGTFENHPERDNAFLERVRDALVLVALRHRGETVVVVTHRGVLSMLHKAIVGHNHGGAVRNCGICEVQSDGSVHVVVAWNELMDETNATDEGKQALAGGDSVHYY